MKNMNMVYLKRTLKIGFILLILVLGSSYVGLRVWFKADIDQICDNAMKQYDGDKIEALISVLNSDQQDLTTKNSAIWALGKLRNENALPTLRNLQTNEVCDHSRNVCQRELEKAILNLEGKSIDLLTFK